MSEEKNVKAVIQTKLKEIIKLAKEIGTLSEKNYDYDNVQMIFNEHSDEMKMLRRFAKMYEMDE